MTHDGAAGMHGVESAALDWLIRQQDPAFDQWEDFADWLAADPAHAEIYHELAVLDADVGAMPAQVDGVTPDAGAAGNAVPITRRRFSRRAWLGGAIAASVAGLVGVGMFQQSSDSYRVQTAMGEPQLVALNDGSEIAINGGSSVLLSHSDPRRVVLERGQVLLKVVHSDSAPFRVSAGPAELIDVGTVFDVVRSDERVTVAVSEGAVVYNPGVDDIRVDAGYRFTAREDGSASDMTEISLDSVGAWRGGQLVYDGVPLRDVAAEVARTTGIKLRTTPAASGILFRGALRTDLAEERLVGDLAALAGASATRDSGGWTLSR